jgi:sterol desaturase/sphingolipid hydroxylase (fatty acid hydroxylase superfamily)
MIDSLRAHQGEIVGTLFVAVVIAAAWLEVFWPRRETESPRAPRWIANLSLGIGNIILFALMPLGIFAASLMAEQRDWGLLHLAILPSWATLPSWLAVALGVLAIDMIAYVMHRLMHRVPPLWALHHVHHSDPDIDFTTTVRHHPFEALASAVIMFGAVLAFGISPESVVIHQVASVALDFAEHSNWQIPRTLDAAIRLVFVTPDMHMVHHSSLKRETDSNYGTVLSLWDRVFGTYVAAPAGGMTGMTIGLEYARAPADQRLDRVLLAPFVKPAGSIGATATE